MKHEYEKYRLQLEELKSELETRVAKANTSLSASHSTDWSEQAVERENDEVLVELVREGKEELEQIKLAFMRMDKGHYGTCVTCGAAINPQRLNAMPMATLCVECASAT
jgi:RNA polymerase-binding transcription factor